MSVERLQQMERFQGEGVGTLQQSRYLSGFSRGVGFLYLFVLFKNL